MTNNTNNRESLLKHKRTRVKKCFTDFINIMDTNANTYIMLSLANNNITTTTTTSVPITTSSNKVVERDVDDLKNKDNKDNKDNIAKDKRYVSKNADNVPLPPPRENPECIYHCDAESHDSGESGDNTKINPKIKTSPECSEDRNIEFIQVDIDGKNACYDINCVKCRNKIPFKINKINIDVDIKNISDLIQLCNDYKMAENIEYNINMKSLHRIKADLIELNSMIGMKALKENIVDQLLYYLQNLHVPVLIPTHLNKQASTGDFLHTVIYGSPGTGKTEVAKIIGRIYSNLGIIKSRSAASSASASAPVTLSSIISDKKKASSSASSSSSAGASSSAGSSSSSSRPRFKKVTRADLIAGYLGQTALKTKDVIKDSLGGVLFIDEAYALGNTDKRDSFAKECIDTLCEALSDNKDNLMVIIAGYEKDLNECFFSYNDGLDSRFTWRFKIDDYTATDLRDIYIKKVNDIGWSITEEIKADWFEKNMKYFKFYGRDMETLFSKTKIAHSRRVFCKPENMKTKITMKDLENGFEMFIRNEEVKKRATSDEVKVVQTMYL